MSTRRVQFVAICCGKFITAPTFAALDESRCCFACMYGDEKYARHIATQLGHLARRQETF